MRNKREVRFEPTASYAVGVDVGGTKINAGIINSRGEIVYSKSLPTLAGRCRVEERIGLAIAEVLQESCDEEDAMPLRGIGIGTAGQVHWQTGAIRFASELLPGYTGTPLKALMERKFGMPVSVDNDVNVLALAELFAGSAKETGHMICLALGTGVGGVIVDNGKILRGLYRRRVGRCGRTVAAQNRRGDGQKNHALILFRHAHQAIG